MNNLIAALFERLAAVWIERIAGGYISTLAGVLGIVATSIAQLTTYIPPQYSAYVSLGGVILAGLAAILARDGASKPSVTAAASGVSSTAKTGVVALMALVLVGTLPVVGCSRSQVAQDIVSWTPALQSAIATVDTAATALLPADAAIFAAATVGFDAASNLVVAEAKAYLANPSASVLAQLQTAISTLQANVNASVLAAAKITNASSQAHALSLINTVSTIVSTMLALVASISSKTAVAQMATQSTVKLAAVRPYLDMDRAARILSAHYDEPLPVARMQMAQFQLATAQAGF